MGRLLLVLGISLVLLFFATRIGLGLFGAVTGVVLGAFGVVLGVVGGVFGTIFGLAAGLVGIGLLLLFPALIILGIVWLARAV